MATPVFVACIANQFTLVMQDVTSARIWFTSVAPDRYTYTHVAAGGAAPAAADAVAAPTLDPKAEIPSALIASGEPVDIYVLAHGVDGQVRVDTDTAIGSGALAPQRVVFGVSASLTDGGAGYPFTGYLPNAAGLEIGERRDLLATITATGTVAPATITLTLQMSEDGARWHDVSLDGYSYTRGDDGFAAWVSANAVAIEDLVEWLGLGGQLIRWKYVLTGASGPVNLTGTLHGR